MSASEPSRPKVPLARMLAPLQSALVAVAVALVVVALLSRVMGVTPLAAIKALVYGGFWGETSKEIRTTWVQTLLRAIPILLTGLSVAWAFRAGLFNIGAEGQLLWGAVAAAWIGASVHAPGPVLIFLALLGGAAAGALWAWPAAILKSRRGTPEVVTTLLLTWIAIHLTGWVAAGPLHDPTQQGARTAAIQESARLATFGDTRLHFGLLIAVAAAILLALVLQYAVFGFQLVVVGKNPEAARSSNINVRKMWTLALLQSGALAGLAGAVEVLGIHRYFLSGFSPGYGYEGISVAILGNSTPAGVVLAAVFLGGLANGAVNMAVDLHLSSELGRSMVAVIQALVVLAAAVRRWPSLKPLRLRFRKAS